eukprot:1140108-Pelagomonas_calceolata.AAC.5
MWSHNPRAREMAKALADLGPCHDVKAVFTMRCVFDDGDDDDDDDDKGEESDGQWCACVI